MHWSFWRPALNMPKLSQTMLDKLLFKHIFLHLMGLIFVDGKEEIEEVVSGRLKRVTQIAHAPPLVPRAKWL